MRSNTTNIESETELEQEDRDYYANSGHVIPLRDHALSRADVREQKLMIKAGLTV